MSKVDVDFYKGKKVFITGHTGFKGTWLCKILSVMGAEVCGYAAGYPTVEGKQVFEQLDFSGRVHSIQGDVCDLEQLKACLADFSPDIVFHLAAQPIVTLSYQHPVETYRTNVMGTVNILECVRLTDSVKSVVNVTTDKVYENQEWEWGYRENEPLDGFDPYSNSKSCSELVTHSYNNSFFRKRKIAVSTARAGNVIGGGDFSVNRIIPDCVRAAYESKVIKVRNPYSIRPYQHVLEPLYAYLLLAQEQYQKFELAAAYNVGPDECDCVSTGALVDLFCKSWGRDISWENVSCDGPHEAKFLKLDCSKYKATFKWRPHWHIQMAIEKTIEWAKCWQDAGDINALMELQIKEFFAVDEEKKL